MMYPNVYNTPGPMPVPGSPLAYPVGNTTLPYSGTPLPAAAPKQRRRIWTWLFPGCAACILLIALILGIIGLAVPYWLTGDVVLMNTNVNRHIGIWSTCGNVVGTSIDTNCLDFDDVFDSFACPDLEEIMIAVRVLTILAMVLILIAICLVLIAAALYSFIGFICAVLVMVIAIVLLIVAVAIFGAQVPGQAFACSIPGVLFTNGEICPGCSLDWGWVLTLLSLILTTIALVITYCACFFHRRKKQRFASLPPPIPPPAPPLMTSAACCPVPLVSPMVYSPSPRATLPVSPLMPILPEDPLLMRVDAVRHRLHDTLIHDAARMGYGVPHPPMY